MILFRIFLTSESEVQERIIAAADKIGRSPSGKRQIVKMAKKNRLAPKV